MRTATRVARRNCVPNGCSPSLGNSFRRRNGGRSIRIAALWQRRMAAPVEALKGPSADTPIAGRVVPPFALAVVATAAVLPAYMIAASTQLLHVGFGLWFTEVFAFFAVSFVLVRFARRSPLRYTGLDGFALRPVVFGFLVGAANFAAAVVPIQFLATRIAPDWLRDRFDSVRIFESQSGVDLVVLVLAVTLAAPIGEEFFFRGVMQRGLIRRSPESRGMSAAAAIVVTGFVFSAFHLDPVGLAARWELGILFGYLAYRSGSLWPGVAAHAANNLVSTVLFFIARHEAEGAADDSWKPVLALAAVGIPLLAALLLAPKRFTSLLAPPKAWSDDPLPSPSPSLLRLAAPWLSAAFLSIAIVGVVDRRGVQLNYIDMVEVPLPALPTTAPESDRMARDALLPIRAKARRGELSIDFYRSERRKLSGKAKKVALAKDAESGGGFLHGEHAVDIAIPVEDDAAAEQLKAAAEQLGTVLQSEKSGEVDGVEADSKRVVVHLYGRSADELLDAARKVFGQAGVKRGTARLRRGPHGTAFVEEQL